MNDVTEWKRKVAVRTFNEIKSGADRRGEPMSDQRIAAAAAGYVDATPADVLKWVRSAANV